MQQGTAKRLGLFTADQVCTLCRISPRQLAYWDRTGFFKPQYADDLKRPFNRIYSFRDVVGLRTVGFLRNKHNVPLGELRRIGKELNEIPEANWSNLTIYLGEDRHPYFKHPKDGAIVAAHPLGQRPLFKMVEIIRQIEKDLARMNRRKPSQLGKIEQHRHVVRNAPVIAGTRIPTTAIYNLHEAGYSVERIISEYPRLTQADVKAAIQHERLRYAS
ncbi:MAG TPA: DUF433 domain-containing protein [Candidatus Binataceae bacterium]|nr:DUF433 domain-containing protein [Candidatus Binataceae bacterium]